MSRSLDVPARPPDRHGKPPQPDLVPHPRADIVFGTGAAMITYDPETFDDHDDEVTRLFDGD